VSFSPASARKKSLEELVEISELDAGSDMEISGHSVAERMGGKQKKAGQYTLIPLSSHLYRIFKKDVVDSGCLWKSGIKSYPQSPPVYGLHQAKRAPSQICELPDTQNRTSLGVQGLSLCGTLLWTKWVVGITRLALRRSDFSPFSSDPGMPSAKGELNR